MLGFVGFAGQFPVFLLAPIGGGLADIRNRHRIIVICQTLASERPDASGKRTACRSGPVHDFPKSSLRRIVLPQ